MFVPHVAIKLPSVLERGYCFFKFIICYYLHCIGGVYVCSSCCDKAAVCSWEGVLFLSSLFVITFIV